MPQQNRPIPGSVSDWLARAKGDLILAKGPLQEGAFLEDLCFHAQQAVEKAIKAFYVYQGLVFRYTHDLDELLTGLREHGISIPEKVEDSIVLTTYAWGARYPGVAEPVTEEEYRLTSVFFYPLVIFETLNLFNSHSLNVLVGWIDENIIFM